MTEKVSLSTRLDRDVYDVVKARAERERRSINSLINQLLADAVGTAKETDHAAAQPQLATDQAVARAERR